VKTVSIRGGGIAGSCCAYRVPLESAHRPKLPAIMLGETAQRLFEDVFERDDLFRVLHLIQRRAVCWGENAEPVVLPHSALVVSEEEILGRIHTFVGPDRPPPEQEPFSRCAAWLEALNATSAPERLPLRR
jgi:hypothetical protein